MGGGGLTPLPCNNGTDNNQKLKEMVKATYYVRSDVFVVYTERKIVYRVRHPTHAEIAANLPAGVMLEWNETE